MSEQRERTYAYLCWFPPRWNDDGHVNQDQVESCTETLTPCWPMHRLDGEHADDEPFFECWADKVGEIVAVQIMDELHPETSGDNSFRSRAWRLAQMIDEAMFPLDGSKIEAGAAAHAVAERLLPYAQFWFPELPADAAWCLVWGLLMERIGVLVTQKDYPPGWQLIIVRSHR